MLYAVVAGGCVLFGSFVLAVAFGRVLASCEVDSKRPLSFVHEKRPRRLPAPHVLAAMVALERERQLLLLYQLDGILWAALREFRESDWGQA